MTKKNNAVLSWLAYEFSWWVIRRYIRRNRSKLIAAGVVGLVVVGGAFASRSGSD
ncbi:MAG TPA: hypothetical protein VH300_16965 [Thermoleophilaceae bacterium]|nr:hypothetical protein [Thermoleophilaceae bacterium]